VLEVEDDPAMASTGVFIVSWGYKPGLGKGKTKKKERKIKLPCRVMDMKGHHIKLQAQLS
jgi:hypothetical protein